LGSKSEEKGNAAEKIHKPERGQIRTDHTKEG